MVISNCGSFAKIGTNNNGKGLLTTLWLYYWSSLKNNTNLDWRRKYKVKIYFFLCSPFMFWLEFPSFEPDQLVKIIYIWQTLFHIITYIFNIIYKPGFPIFFRLKFWESVPISNLQVNTFAIECFLSFIIFNQNTSHVYISLNYWFYWNVTNKQQNKIIQF